MYSIGEFAVIKGNDANNCLVKTTIPKTCTVFTLYHKESRTGILAHIDDYTEVVGAVDKISKVLKNTCDLPINACFTAKIFGGTEDAFSK